MDLGTGKDAEEYGDIPYHMIDIVHPNEIFSLYDYLEDVKKIIQDIINRGKTVIICGGSPLYVNAILQKYALTKSEVDKNLREELNGLNLNELQERLKSISLEVFNSLNADDRINPLRIRRQIELLLTPADNETGSAWPDFTPLVLGVYYPRAIVRQRVDERLKKRFDLGMIDEVKFIHESENVSYDKLESFGLEYREIAKFLQNEYTFEELYSQLLNKIRQFVKRQDIFFRKMEREGIKIHWIDEGNPQTAATLIENFLKK